MSILVERCLKVLASGPGGVFRCTATEHLCRICGHCCEDRVDYDEPAVVASHCQCTLEDFIKNMSPGAIVPLSAPNSLPQGPASHVEKQSVLEEITKPSGSSRHELAKSDSKWTKDAVEKFVDHALPELSLVSDSGKVERDRCHVVFGINRRFGEGISGFDFPSNCEIPGIEPEDDLKEGDFFFDLPSGD